MVWFEEYMLIFVYSSIQQFLYVSLDRSIHCAINGMPHCKVIIFTADTVVIPISCLL
uniref:Uncharacterized protein n=1 Tax=Anguilla anguilla TaxID=7936 RepID=A0A0E9S0T2_ANGAN